MFFRIEENKNFSIKKEIDPNSIEHFFPKNSNNDKSISVTQVRHKHSFVNLKQYQKHFVRKF